MLEVFNTLLRQLRLSIDYALTGSYDLAVPGGTKIIKEHEERMLQEAIIKTSGTGGLCRWPGKGRLDRGSIALWELGSPLFEITATRKKKSWSGHNEASVIVLM